MTAPIRIRYQFATAKQHSEVGMAEVERRQGWLDRWAGPGVEVKIGLPKSGPGSVESRTDAALTVPETLRNAVAAEKEGFDAIIVSCFSDPGMEPARELVSIPVLGSGICAMHLAGLLGGRFSIMSPREGGGSRAYENPRKYGLSQNYASTRGVGLSVMDLAKDRAETVARIAEVGRRAVKEDGADTLILGCMSMAFHNITDEISREVGVPVINPVPASLTMAAGSGSQRSKPQPRSLSRRVVRANINLHGIAKVV